MKFIEKIFDKIRNNVNAPSVVKLEGINEAGFCFICAAIHARFPDRDLLIVLENSREQEKLFNEFQTWQKLFSSEKERDSDNAAVPLFFSAWDVLPNDGRLPGVDSISDRLTTISKLFQKNRHALLNQISTKNIFETINGSTLTENNPQNRGCVVFASSVSLIQKTLSPEFLAARILNLKIGDKINLYQISEHLVNAYYDPVAKVGQKGEFSVRGGILDVYPLSSELPVRIEFFGDLIDSMRVFDPITQISQEAIDSVSLSPAGEFAILKNLSGKRAYETTKNPDKNFSEKIIALEDNPRIVASADKSFLKNSGDIEGVFASTLLDYFNKNAILILCEPERIEESVHSFCSDFGEDEPLYCSWEEIIDRARRMGMEIIELTENIQSSPETSHVLFQNTTGCAVAENPSENRLIVNHDSDEINLDAEEKIVGFLNSLEAWRPLVEHGIEYQIHQLQTQSFFAQIQNWITSGYTALLICPHETQFERFKELWAEFNLNKQYLPDKIQNSVQNVLLEKLYNGFNAEQKDGRILFFQGSINRGFIIADEKFVVISDTEIFGRIKTPQPRSLKSKYRAHFFHQFIDLAELEEGDYVVHANYGIGRFLGLTKLSADSKSGLEGEECLVIEYAPSKKGQEPPKLYVPVNEAHLVTKYVGTGRGRPILNKLTGKKWQNTKEKAQNAIKDYASKLLTLQAERMITPGFAFLPDTPWQHDFENSFEFEETPDQLRAIMETKKDMESPKPMDRLICGDAGYGKTEVALRAAFKAVMSGKQVAVLAPTTVLAQQHYMTFTSRMAAFPINICLLSRFKTRAQQKELIEQIANGSIDIVIGTHRIIQDDVQFHDLGLLIIDEEQRFGVLHKEKLKFLKRQVDVLTLSATPIPRTLYLSLMGARDMSIIETPPHDRLPIETIVARYDDNLVRDAIRRELNRGGQVFYLHNQIYDIEDVADKLKKLVPEARIVVGHGRMPASKLEKVMSAFITGKADVLLSTTIVENGLDIPNANTIIIDRADKYGLSDLYQLRGRVGRYRRQAYAYLLIPRHTELLADARKRIAAIKQYSTPGSGFKVAMRDLEIRGAGNILGVEQSGHIAAIGFHLYCQLLNQAIKSLKGQKSGVVKNVATRLDFLITNPAQEIPQKPPSRKPKIEERKPFLVPREVAVYVDDEDSWREQEDDVRIEYAPAYIPADYIQDYSQRTEIYRKIAQASTIEELAEVEKEIRDRFGKIPPAVKYFLLLEEIKIIAAEKGITSIETEGNKLKVIRNNDYLMIAGKFPRLTRIKPEAKIKEIIHLLKSL